MTGPLANLPRLTGTRSGRASSWDRSGGNDDRLTIRPGGRAVLADLGEAGVVRHIWMTIACREIHYLRKIVLRAFWDRETDPSIEVPVGDFFGIGHAQTRNFVSLPLQMSPEDGKGFNCWFPMPFERARFEVENECAADVLLYYYIDYEVMDADPRMGRFHAQFRRENPTDGISDEGMTNDEFQPALHGTGTEDYFNTAWCPTQEYHAPYHGLTMPGEQNWWGKVSMYRFHIEDPVRFRRSIRVTIEHGHANHRSDDYSSTAYWYQAEPHASFPALPPVAERLPREDEPTP